MLIAYYYDKVIEFTVKNIILVPVLQDGEIIGKTINSIFASDWIDAQGNCTIITNHKHNYFIMQIV